MWIITNVRKILDIKLLFKNLLTNFLFYLFSWVMAKSFNKFSLFTLIFVYAINSFLLFLLHLSSSKQQFHLLIPESWSFSFIWHWILISIFWNQWFSFICLVNYFITKFVIGNKCLLWTKRVSQIKWHSFQYWKLYILFVWKLSTLFLLTS